MNKESTTELYTWEEVYKLIEAIREMYKISKCDCLPYQPKPIKVQLIAKEMEEKES
jgi:hypothetical protein